MKYITYIITGLLLLCIIPVVKVHAAFTYTDYTINYTVVVNTAPVANAGPDRTIILPTNSVTIPSGEASATDSDGTVSSIGWTKITAPGSYTITNGSGLTPTFSNLVEGTYTFRLTVTDNRGATSTDDMNVVVTEAKPDLVVSVPTPSTAIVGSPVTFQSTVTNQGSASTGTEPFSNFIQINDTDHSPILVTKYIATNAIAATGTATISTLYTFPSAGTWYTRACADSSSEISETSESNNCGPSTGWNEVVVTDATPAAPTASISANPTSITSGSSANITWTCSSSATTCAGSNFATGNANSGTVSVSPTANTTYSVTASNTGGSDTKSVTVTVTAAPPPPPPPGGTLCSNGTDDDGDGKIDATGGPNGEPADPGCSSTSDNSEDDPKPIYIDF